MLWQIASYRERFCSNSLILPICEIYLHSWFLKKGFSSRTGFSHSEFSHKIENGLAQGSRVNFAFHRDKGIEWANELLNHLESQAGFKIARSLFEEFLQLVSGERLIGTALGFDERAEIGMSRAKFWVAVSYPSLSVQNWLLSHCSPPPCLPTYSQEYVLIGVDMFLDGRTRLKPYVTCNRHIPAILDKIGGIQKPIFEYLAKSPTIHFAFSSTGEIALHASGGPPPFLGEDPTYQEISRFYADLGLPLRFVSIPLTDARAGLIHNYSLYY